MTAEESTDGTAIDPDRLRSEIQVKYHEVATQPDASYHFFTGRRAARQVGYPEGLIDALPDEVVEAFAGVANPFHWGVPQTGERVVDIGSGGGLDSIIAAQAVGAEGRVVGVDMTPEMLDRARHAAEATDLSERLEFREGLAEELPVPDGWADLVISNGVFNLLPDKHGAYREVARILKPGGRLQFADICVEKPVPESARRDIDLWTG